MYHAKAQHTINTIQHIFKDLSHTNILKYTTQSFKIGLAVIKDIKQLFNDRYITIIIQRRNMHKKYISHSHPKMHHKYPKIHHIVNQKNASQTLKRYIISSSRDVHSYLKTHNVIIQSCT